MLLSVLKLFPIWLASCEQVSSKLEEHLNNPEYLTPAHWPSDKVW
jgi:hypothetical protein